MKDRTRLAITGAVALVALVATIGGHGFHIDLGRGGSGSGDRDEGAPSGREAQALADLRDFDGVALAGPDDLVVTHGAGFSVRAEGDRDALDRLRLYVKDRTLHVERKDRDRGRSDGGATVRVTLPALARVSLTGPGDISVDRLDGKAVKAEVTGPGALSIGRLSADSADLALTGSGDLTVAGTVGTATLRATGSGDIAARGLRAERASLDLIGSGDIFLGVSREADISILGSGSAHVTGTTTCKVTRLGSGKADCTG